MRTQFREQRAQLEQRAQSLLDANKLQEQRAQLEQELDTGHILHNLRDISQQFAKLPLEDPPTPQLYAIYSPLLQHDVALTTKIQRKIQDTGHYSKRPGRIHNGVRCKGHKNRPTSSQQIPPLCSFSRRKI